MDYEEAKKIVINFFDGITQPVATVCKALEIISERDYNDIQSGKRWKND